MIKHNYECLDCGKLFDSSYYSGDMACSDCGGFNWKYWGTGELFSKTEEKWDPDNHKTFHETLCDGDGISEWFAWTGQHLASVGSLKQVKELFKARLTMGYCAWVSAGGNTIEVPPEIIEYVTDQMDQLSMSAVKAILDGNTSFVFDAAKTSPKLFTPTWSPSSLTELIGQQQQKDLEALMIGDCSDCQTEPLTMAKVDKVIDLVKKGKHPDSVIIDDVEPKLTNWNTLESDLVSLMEQDFQEAGESLTLKAKIGKKSLYGEVYGAKPVVIHALSDVYVSDNVKEKLAENMQEDLFLDVKEELEKFEPTSMCQDCQIKPAVWFAHPPDECDDADCDCEPQCSECLTASVKTGKKSGEYQGMEKESMNHYQGVPLYDPEKAGCPPPVIDSTLAIMTGMDGGPKPKFLPVALSVEEMALQAINFGVQEAVAKGLSYSILDPYLVTSGMKTIWPPASVDLKGRPPIIKNHTHLLDGKRQRCVNDNCPVGS